MVIIALLLLQLSVVHALHHDLESAHPLTHSKADCLLANNLAAPMATPSAAVHIFGPPAHIHVQLAETLPTRSSAFHRARAPPHIS